MSYAKDGFPIEQASKIGHLKLIQNQNLQELIKSFESISENDLKTLPEKTGNLNFDRESKIKRIITVDGGQAVVPNPIKRQKSIAYIQVVASSLLLKDLEYMKEHPFMDPRDVTKMLNEKIVNNSGALPLSGIRIPGQSIPETIRILVRNILNYSNLYSVLKFLVFHEWDNNWNPPKELFPHMNCVHCNEEFSLTKNQIIFNCPNPKCGKENWLSDYLYIGRDSSDEWAKEEIASALRDVLETLQLFYFISNYYKKNNVMEETLFIKDGPLLLRAALSRLVEPIRAFFEYFKSNSIPLYLVGIEKTGTLVDFLNEFESKIDSSGDFFLPTIKYLLEEINGTKMNSNYRNRVSYGAKLGIRISKHHILALNIPTGEFLMEPKETDLIGFYDIGKTLSQVVSYQYPNSIIPLVLTNSYASIARKPSGDILTQFTDKLLQS